MATQPCRDCDQPVSLTAYYCPNCGRVMINGFFFNLIIGGIFIVLLLR